VLIVITRLGDIVVDRGNDVPRKFLIARKDFQFSLAFFVKNFPNFFRTENADVSDIT
jgi:hypothetical protein